MMAWHAAGIGIDAAALRPQENQGRIVLMRSPAWYGPDCRRERFARRYARAAEILGKSRAE